MEGYLIFVVMWLDLQGCAAVFCLVRAHVCTPFYCLQMFRKLVSQGMTEADEEKLLSMKDFIVKLHRSRAG